MDSTVRAGGKQVVVNLIIDKSKLFSSNGGALMLFVSGNDFWNVANFTHSNQTLTTFNAFLLPGFSLFGKLFCDFNLYC